MLLADVVRTAIDPALFRLPEKMDSLRARILLLAIGLQESAFRFRRQTPAGPARGFWQFELGTARSRGGVTGVALHPETRQLFSDFCYRLSTSSAPNAVYWSIEHDDVLAAGVARLLLWTAPEPLPEVGEVDAAWTYYERLWRPGKPRPEKWAANYARALAQMDSHVA